MANAELEYRPGCKSVIERTREWFKPEGKIHNLVTIIPGSWNSFNWDLSIDVPTPKSLEEYDYSDDVQLREHLDFRLKQFETYWEKKLEWTIDDDMMPVFEPKIGWAEGPAALVDAEVTYYAQTSNLKPVIESYDSFDWNRIGLRQESPGAELLAKINKYAVEKAAGKFLVMPRGETVNPSDLAKACRGNELFTDFVNSPDNVHELMKRCLSATIDLIEYVRGTAGESMDGHGVSWNGGYWVPGTMLGHVGDNVSDLISPKMYMEFIFPYIKQFGEHFGGIIFGRDVSSSHLWPILPQYGVIRAFKPRNMGSVPVTPEDIRKIAAVTEGLPLFVEVHNFDDLPFFKKAVTETNIKSFFIIHCSSREQAQDAVHQIRDME